MALAGRASPGGPVDDVVLNAGHWPDGPGPGGAGRQRRRRGPRDSAAPSPSPACRGHRRWSWSGSATRSRTPPTAGSAPAEITRLRAPGVPQSTQMLYRFSHAASYGRGPRGRGGGEPGAAGGRGDRARPPGSPRRTQATGNGAIMEPFVVAFALIGLAMAVLIVGNVVSGAVVASYTRIGVLKCIGLTPAQVVVAYLSRVGCRPWPGAWPGWWRATCSRCRCCTTRPARTAWAASRSPGGPRSSPRPGCSRWCCWPGSGPRCARGGCPPRRRSRPAAPRGRAAGTPRTGSPPGCGCRGRPASAWRPRSPGPRGPW